MPTDTEVDRLTARPLTPADAAAVAELCQRQADVDMGFPRPVSDIEFSWASPDFDLEKQTLGVIDPTGALIGYAELQLDGRVLTATESRRDGIEVARVLSQWVLDQAHELGMSTVTLHCRDDSATFAAAQALGWNEQSRSWLVEAAPTSFASPTKAPAEVVIEPALPTDYPSIWALSQSSYLDSSVRRRQSFREWRAHTVDHPGFQPWQLLVARDTKQIVVGTSFLRMLAGNGFVERIAVSTEHRQQGLGQALGANGFALLAEHGAARRFGTTDSWEGVQVMEKVGGMSMVSTWVNMCKVVEWPGTCHESGAFEQCIGDRSGVWLVHQRDSFDALLGWFGQQGLRRAVFDTTRWDSESAMFTDLARVLGFPRYYPTVASLPRALTELATSGGGQSDAGLVIALDHFDDFHTRHRAAALALLDALAAATRSATVEGNRLVVVCQTDDPRLRLASSGARMLPEAS